MIGALTASPWSVWGIAALAAAGVILRPFAWPEFIWAVTGAGLLIAFRLLPAAEALAAVAKGTDVYLFLIGMMLLAELARHEGLFDWLAAKAAGMARGSATRLFSLVFAVGTMVTVFLSNDATAVVLTPAVAAVVKAAKAKEALPYLFICAFVANAASFVLPISNPANLVIYGSRMPPLLHWLALYSLPSLLSVAATYAALRWSQRAKLRQSLSPAVEVPALTSAGKMAAAGIVATALALLTASAFDVQLGLPTFLAGVATAILVLMRSHGDPLGGPLAVVRGISWGVLPLVAGLFVLVQALQHTGVTGDLADLLRVLVAGSAAAAVWAAAAVLAVGCNLVNNLPAALLSGRVAQLAHVAEPVRAAMLIGVDLGPNLSVTGSLATILWLTALRREGLWVSAWSFLKLGALVMPPALILAIAGIFVFG
ncbi:MAG TPA: arsenic transporter [Rhodopila sp.]|jgi:arsenical pump membrane protein